MRFVRFLLPLLAALPAAAQLATALPPATLGDLAQVTVTTSAARHLHRRSNSFSFGETPFVDAMTANATIAAPAVATAFESDAATGGFAPDAGGAVGPRHVVSVDNLAVTVFDRTGKQLVRTTIGQFWHDPSVPDGTLYDSRIAYDAAADRFVIAALYDHGGIGNESTLMFAATATGDPTGAWYRYRLRVDGANVNSADFTRLALTDQQVMATANIYPGSAPDPSFANVYLIAKSSLYGGGMTQTPSVASTPGIVDVAPVGTFDRGDPRVWVVGAGSDGVTALDATHSFARVVHFGAPLPILTMYTTNFGAQLGSGTLMDTGDMVPQTALIRSGALWVVQTAEPAVGPQRTSILAYRVELATNAMTNVLVDDPSGATTYGFPSLAVNRNGAAFLAYAQYNAAYYASAAFTYVDSQGNTTPSTFLKQGMATYSYVGANWADFTTAVVDPLDDAGFWTVQVLPRTISGLPAWATWWFNVPVSAAPARHRAARH